jgi:hypothetical protein
MQTHNDFYGSDEPFIKSDLSNPADGPSLSQRYKAVRLINRHRNSRMDKRSRGQRRMRSHHKPVPEQVLASAPKQTSASEPFWNGSSEPFLDELQGLALSCLSHRNKLRLDDGSHGVAITPLCLGQTVVRRFHQFKAHPSRAARFSHGGCLPVM